MTTKSDIIAGIEDCDAEDIAEIVAAVEARKAKHKAELIQQCAAMGIHLDDGNGKKRGRRADAKHVESN